MSARTVFLDGIEPVLTELGVRLVRGARASIGEIQKPVALARTESYEATPAAPRRNVTWNGTLTLVVPNRNPVAAEQELEDLFEELAPSLLSSRYAFVSATLADWTDQMFCLDIAIRAIFQKE